MTPSERQDALMRVYVRLAEAHGRAPSTSEIARAAGVAEGTIYRAFPTKEALQEEAVDAAFCPGPWHGEITRIDRDQPLRERLVDFTRILQRRLGQVFALMGALGLTEPPQPVRHLACFAVGRHLRDAVPDVAFDGPSAPASAAEPAPFTEPATATEPASERSVHGPLLEAMESLLGADRDRLTVPPQQVIRMIRLLTFSGSHPGITDGELLTPEEIVDTLLDGVRRRDEQPAQASEARQTA